MFGTLLSEHGLYLCIWENKAKSSRFFCDIEEAAAYASETSAAGAEVYVGQGVFEKPIANGRGQASDVAAISSVWADVDILHEAHASEKSYPPDAETAGQLARIGPHRPTLVVSSGYGLHAYWQFRDPWVFEDDNEREEAALFLRRVGVTLQSRAKDRGFELDQVHDLARILRIPGTLNWKGKAPKPVEELPIFSSGVTYLHDDLEDWLVDRDSQSVQVKPGDIDVGNVYFELPPTRNPDEDWVLNMSREIIAVDPDFEQMWDFRDKRFGKDASRYELAFANRLASFDCTDQQIADFNYYWRKTIAKKPAKHFRAMQMTIEKARSNYISECNLAAMTSGEGDSFSEEEILNAINRVFSLSGERSIIRFVQWGEDNAQFAFELHDGDMLGIGGADVLLSAALLNRRFVERFSLMIDDQVRKGWNSVVRQLLLIVDKREGVTNDRESYELLDRLCSYMDDRDPATDIDDVADAKKRQDPFVEQGFLWFNFQDFNNWVRLAGDRVASQTISGWVHLLGGKKKTFKIEGRRNRFVGVPYSEYTTWIEARDRD